MFSSCLQNFFSCEIGRSCDWIVSQIDCLCFKKRTRLRKETDFVRLVSKINRYKVLYKSLFDKNQRDLTREISKKVIDDKDSSQESSDNQNFELERLFKEPMSAKERKLLAITAKRTLDLRGANLNLRKVEKEFEIENS